MTENYKVTVLLGLPEYPNLLNLTIAANWTFKYIQRLIWEQADRDGYGDNLGTSDGFHFEYINGGSASPERVFPHQWNRRISDVDIFFSDQSPFLNVLRCVPTLPGDDEQLDKINKLVGTNIQLLEKTRDPEVMVFRKAMQSLVSEQRTEFDCLDWESRVLCEYPMELMPSDTPKLLKRSITISLCSVYSTSGASQALEVSLTMTASQLLVIAVEKHNRCVDVDTHDKFTTTEVLKVFGRRQYLLGNHPLYKYKYINDCVVQRVRPSFVLVSRESILADTDPIYHDFSAESQHDLPESEPVLTPVEVSSEYFMFNESKCSFDFDESVMYSIRFVNFKDNTKMLNKKSDDQQPIIFAGIFHADQSLCPQVSVDLDPGVEITFGISVSNLPRSARLCLSLAYGNKKSKKIREQDVSNLIGWINMPVFDYRGRLRTGKMILNLWPYSECCLGRGLEKMFLKPIEPTTFNPDKDTSPEVSLFILPHLDTRKIFYPEIDKMLIEAGERMSPDDFASEPSTEELAQLFSIITNDSLDWCDQERDLVWKYPYSIMNSWPMALPKVLLSIQWNDRESVCRMYSLLKGWPSDIPVSVALEMLDFPFADFRARNFAIKILQSMPAEELGLYLPQLVQCLKYENYLKSDLVLFLIKNAIGNRSFGQRLYYCLRAEMAVGSVNVRFALIIDAFLRCASPSRMESLVQQCEVTDRLHHLSTLVAKLCSQGHTRDKTIKSFQNAIKDAVETTSLANFSSPLHSDIILKDLLVTKCKFMDSKMRPLWMSWSTEDSQAEAVTIIYKKGDDLRQDMLTLQMFTIMETIWQKAGLNLRLTPYRVLSCGPQEGFIEVIKRAHTLANIQKLAPKNVGSPSWPKDFLYRWLMDKNAPNKEIQTAAIDSFTSSCAAYCLATFVLGIGDRHSDNIMITESGQFFHIDFGHFLGNFKKKFMFKREVVRFVLVDDFNYIISHGDTNMQKLTEFRELCERGYLELREHSSLFITLFMVMVYTGMPELSSIENLKYLRESLQINKSQKEALAYFREVWEEAIRLSWTVRLNWIAHNLKRDNS